MTQQIAIASMYCDYEGAYQTLNIKPHYYIWLAARDSANPFYLEDIMKRGAEQGIDVTSGFREWDGTTDCIKLNLERTRYLFHSPLHAALMDDEVGEYGIYFGEQPHSSLIELYVWQSMHKLRKIDASGDPCWKGDTEYLEENNP